MTSIPRVAGLPAFLALLLCLAPVETPRAQDGLVPSTAADAGMQEPAVAGDEVEGLDSGPRAALRAFFRAMEAGDLERAARTFQPDAFPSEREAREAARTLYDDVFLRTRRLSLGVDVPDDEGVGGDVYVLTTWPDGKRELAVNLTLRRFGERFLFSAATLRRLPEIAGRLAGVGLSESVLGEFSALEALRSRVRGSLPEPLRARSFLIENWQWLGLLLLALLSVLVDRFFRRVAFRLTVRVLRGRGIRLPDDVVTSFGRPLGLLVGALTFQLLLPALGLDAGVRDMLLLAAGFVAAVAGVWAAYRFVDLFCDYLAEKASNTQNKFDDMLVPLARRTLKIFVSIVGIVFVASHVSEDLWGVVAGLGLGSIAVGFAARDSIENLFGTFTVLLDKPFQIGDWVIVGDLEGTVESVGFRSTRIRTFYNSLITVPNREFIASAVDNMGERAYRRIKTMLSLTYDTPPEKIEAFCEGVREILRRHPYTRKDYYHVYLNAFGPSSLDVLLYCFVETPEWATELREKHRLFADILRLAERLEVSFAFPTQTLHVARPEDELHPNRPPDDAAGARLGGRLAAEVVRASMGASGASGGAKPPPVSIERNPRYGDEGEDGG